MNRRGVTLIELLVVITIVGILALISAPMYTMGFRMVRRLTEKTLEAQEIYAKLQALQESIASQDILDWKNNTEEGIGQPLLCFQNGLVFVCEEDKPCLFEEGVWSRGNKECSEGILLRNQ